MESILDSIKKMLGLTPEYTQFDTDIIMHINSVFMILTQLGVGPSEGFAIEDNETTWTEFVPDIKKVSGIKSYMYAKVRVVFDPPTSSVVMDSLTRIITEYEWRLNVA
mgnify:CR=1 FL=1